MSNVLAFSDLEEGVLAEIVSIDNDDTFEMIGANAGMSVVMLNRAVASLIQIGVAQLEVPQEILSRIWVKIIEK